MAHSHQVKRPTTVDVAKLAGVSLTTVSYVINDVKSAGISAATRARVLEAIAQLDYHPYEAARSLRSKASYILGVAVPDAHNPHYLDLINGIEREAHAHAYNTSLILTNFQAAAERRCLQWLKQRRYDALIMALGSGAEPLADIFALHQQGYHITGIGFQTLVKATTIDDVALQPAVGERQAIEHLVSLGHRKIGHIFGVADQATFGGRLEVARSIQRELGLPLDERWIRRCGPTQEDGYQATCDLVAQCPGDEMPTALLVVNDFLAIAVLSALAESHIAVPDQMSVVAFDNTPQARFTIPPLTTVDFQAQHAGEMAARITLERLADPDAPAQMLTSPARLIVRRSTGPAPLA